MIRLEFAYGVFRIIARSDATNDSIEKYIAMVRQVAPDASFIVQWI